MRFFLLNPLFGPKRHYTYFSPLSDHRGDAPRCPRCTRLTGLIPWLPPYQVELELDRNVYGDLVFGPGEGLLVSERFRECYTSAELGGLKNFHPVTVIKVTARNGRLLRNAHPPKYFYTVPQKGSARIDDRASEVERKPGDPCSTCMGPSADRAKRIVIEESTWDGADIFTSIGLSGYRICTDRFVQACHEHNITNAEFVAADAVDFDWWRFPTHLYREPFI